MIFKPQNRHLLIQTKKQDDSDNSGVLLPEGYVVPKDKYVVATVKSTAIDCKRDSIYNKLLYQEGARIVVDGTMIENVSVAGEEYEIVLENHVVGMFVQGE